MRSRTRVLAILAGVTIAAGCSEPGTTPGSEPDQQPEATISAHRAPDAGATTSWTELAISLTERSPVNVARLYAYLGMAQYQAAEAAEDEHRAHKHGRGCFRRQYRARLATSAAIGGASAHILTSFFPANADEIAAALAAQQAAVPPGKADDFEESAAMGADIAAEVLTYAAGDRVGLADPGTPPIGDGYWKWSGGPIARGNYQARSFFMSSEDQFQPAPPPAFGSAPYLSALAEVRQISDTRTAEQLAIAQFWNVQQSPGRDTPWNRKAVELIRRDRVSDARAARIMFTMNAAVFDALVGCFNAKYHYWFIRPPQADPLITLPIGLPPHPSYPSAHSCVSGAHAGALKAFFPRDASDLDAMALESSLSRLYGGIHYRFDMEAGLALGRAAARNALRSNLNNVNGQP